MPDSPSPITFTAVRLPWGWLGNMSPHPVVYAGETWKTAEHLFQALRFPQLPGNVFWAAITNCPSPMGAKMYAKSQTDRMIVTPRSAADLDNMYTVLTLKLQQHPELANALLTTGDAAIIEDVSKRPSESGLFWGAARHDAGWRGQNHLGRLWQRIRSELRDKQT